MFRFSIIKSSIKIISNNNGVLSSPISLHLQVSSLISNPFSTIISKSPNSSTDYLINSLGLSQLPESVSVISRQIYLKDTSKPDSVLALFKDYGFSKMHIASILSRYPSLLVADPIKNLKPKLDYLSENGFSGRDLVQVVLTDPSILKRSLDKQIIPCFDFLLSFFGTNNDIVSLFSVKRGVWILHKFTEDVWPNVTMLRRSGVPDSSIKRFIMVRPRTLARKSSEFDEIVREIREMGFDPWTLMFVHAVCTMAGMKKEKWVSKFNLFKRFGWTEEQIRTLIFKQPKIMDSSEEKLKIILDFCLKKLEWKADDIIKYPTVLISSVENRLLPRFSIYQVLNKRGLVSTKSVGRALLVPDGKFLVKFVLNHQGKIPQILEMYQSKTRRSQLVASV